MTMRTEAPSHNVIMVPIGEFPKIFVALRVEKEGRGTFVSCRTRGVFRANEVLTNIIPVELGGGFSVDPYELPYP